MSSRKVCGPAQNLDSQRTCNHSPLNAAPWCLLGARLARPELIVINWGGGGATQTPSAQTLWAIGRLLIGRLVDLTAVDPQSNEKKHEKHTTTSVEWLGWFTAGNLSLRLARVYWNDTICIWHSNAIWHISRDAALHSRALDRVNFQGKILAS